MSEPIHPEVRIGHAHLRVGDLERATAFYRDVLGFDVIAYGPDVGMPGLVFLSAGGLPSPHRLECAGQRRRDASS